MPEPIVFQGSMTTSPVSVYSPRIETSSIGRSIENLGERMGAKNIAENEAADREAKLAAAISKREAEAAAREAKLAAASAKREAEKRQATRDRLELATLTTEAIAFSAEYMSQSATAPSTTQTIEFGQAAQEFQTRLLETASNDEVKAAAKVATESVFAGKIPDALRLEGLAKAQKTLTQYSTSVKAASDIVAFGGGTQVVVAEQSALLEAQVAEATGTLVDAGTAAQMRDQIIVFQLSSVDLIVQDNPAEARKVLKNIKGISGADRATKQRMIASQEATANTLSASLVSQTHADVLAFVASSGSPPIGFDLQASVQGLPKTTQAAMMKKFKSAEKANAAIYNTKQILATGDLGAAIKYVDGLTTDPNVAGYADMANAQAQARTAIQQYGTQLNIDPAGTVVSTSAALAQLSADITTQVGGADKWTPELKQRFIAATLDAQTKAGVPSYSQSPVPVSEVKQLAASLTQNNAQGIVSGLIQAHDIYGPYYTSVLADAQGLSGDAKIPPFIAIASTLVRPDGSTPTWLPEFIEANKQGFDAVKTAPGASKSVTTLATEVNILATSPMGKKYARAQYAAHGVQAATTVDGMFKAVATYGVAINDTKGAFDRTINEQYVMAPSNGQTLLIPYYQNDITVDEQAAARITQALELAIDANYQRKYVGRLGEPEGAANPGVQPGMLNAEQLQIPAGLDGDAVRVARLADMYWATDKSGTGVVLMSPSRGSQLTPTAVVDRNGEPITRSFVAVLDWANEKAAAAAKRNAARRGLPELRSL